tara:strand:+ start:267 stop:929 length:663 start_codon:yes stop_codon:yes gene_type:complete
MKKIKKQLPKAQTGFFKMFNPKNWKAAVNAFKKSNADQVAASKLVYKADGTLDGRFKVNSSAGKFNKNTGKGKGKGSKTENVKKEPGFLNRAFNKRFQINTPSIKNLTVDPVKLALRNKGKTALLGGNALLAYYLLKRGDGIKDVELKNQFNFDTNLNTFQKDNTNVNMDSTKNPNFKPNMNYSIEKKGGPVKARGGKTAPGMKSKGGGLKMDRNGKFYR